MIPIGETVHHVYQQQHEDEFCEWCDFYGDLDCECGGTGRRGTGETFDYDRCEACDKFLRAIEAAESEAGCKPYEARPALGTMIDDLWNVADYGGIGELRRYVKKALAMFPEIKGHVAKLWGRMVPQRLCR